MEFLNLHLNFHNGWRKFEFFVLKWLKLHLNFQHHGWTKAWIYLIWTVKIAFKFLQWLKKILYFKIAKFAFKFPPWLEKILNFFDLKWLKLYLNFHHSWIKFEFLYSEMAKIATKFPPWIGGKLEFLWFEIQQLYMFQ